MDRKHNEHDEQRIADARDQRATARAIREEVAEILAGALWSLICSGRGPGHRIPPAPSHNLLK